MRWLVKALPATAGVEIGSVMIHEDIRIKSSNCPYSAEEGIPRALDRSSKATRPPFFHLDLLPPCC